LSEKDYNFSEFYVNVTITKEYDFNVQLKHVLEIKVHGLGKYD
jgi:hypothetical protein